MDDMSNPDLVLATLLQTENIKVQLKGLPRPELRKDPIVGRWVIIATDRAKRPLAAKPELMQSAPGACPFCEGNEVNTPVEILAYRERVSKPNDRGWRVRVVA